MPDETKTGIGCYIVLSYLLYWPAVYAVRAGAEWREIPVDWGPPGV
jgi:hypothetical protein